MKTPKNMQICVVRLRVDPDQLHYAVWDTGYSIYGAGGHFAFPGGSQARIPVDVVEWWGTHWIATETQGIACSGQD